MIIDIERMIASDEGKKLIAYLDTKGILTVGIGHNLAADPALGILGRTLRLGQAITDSECSLLFRRDLGNVMEDLDKITNYAKLDTKYQFILINMCFNMGITRLLKFKGMIKYMRANMTDGVVSSIKGSAYAKQLPNRSARMVLLARGIVPDGYL
jgi:lysozyme